MTKMRSSPTNPTVQPGSRCQRTNPRMKWQQENKMQVFHLIFMVCVASIVPIRLLLMYLMYLWFNCPPFVSKGQTAIKISKRVTLPFSAGSLQPWLCNSIPLQAGGCRAVELVLLKIYFTHIFWPDINNEGCTTHKQQRQQQRSETSRQIRCSFSALSFITRFRD